MRYYESSVIRALVDNPNIEFWAYSFCMRKFYQNILRNVLPVKIGIDTSERFLRIYNYTTGENIPLSGYAHGCSLQIFDNQEECFTKYKQDVQTAIDSSTKEYDKMSRKYDRRLPQLEIFLKQAEM